MSSCVPPVALRRLCTCTVLAFLIYLTTLSWRPNATAICALADYVQALGRRRRKGESYCIHEKPRSIVVFKSKNYQRMHNLYDKFAVSMEETRTQLVIKKSRGARLARNIDHVVLVGEAIESGRGAFCVSSHLFKVQPVAHVQHST